MNDKYYVIHAGGLPRYATLHAVRFLPLFDTHNDCAFWWARYLAKQNEILPNFEHPIWAITNVPPKKG